MRNDRSTLGLPLEQNKLFLFVHGSRRTRPRWFCRAGRPRWETQAPDGQLTPQRAEVSGDSNMHVKQHESYWEIIVRWCYNHKLSHWLFIVPTALPLCLSVSVRFSRLSAKCITKQEVRHIKWQLAKKKNSSRVSRECSAIIFWNDNQQVRTANGSGRCFRAWALRDGQGPTAMTLKYHLWGILTATL